jgi:hypothetical protein
LNGIGCQPVFSSAAAAEAALPPFTGVLSEKSAAEEEEARGLRNTI